MSQEWPKVSKNERHGYEEPDYYLVGELECYVCHEKFRANEEFNKHLAEAGHRLDAVPVGPPAAPPPPAPEGCTVEDYKAINHTLLANIAVGLRDRAAHLQAELERRDKVLKEIKVEVTSTEPGSLR